MSFAYGSNLGTRRRPNALFMIVANDAALRFSSGRGNPGTVRFIALYIKKYDRQKLIMTFYCVSISSESVLIYLYNDFLYIIEIQNKKGNLKCPNSWNANWAMMSFMSGLRLAFWTPIGCGPPIVRLGSKLSRPRPRAPHEKNSASKYSKFKGNSNRSTSDFGMSLDSPALPPWRRRRRVIKAVVEAAEFMRNAMVMGWFS